MVLNETAAAYGLLQVAFADVTEHFAGTLFYLQRHAKLNLPFEKIFSLRTSDLIRQLRQELKQFDSRSSVERDAQGILDLCTRFENLLKWRNDRIHARVRLLADGYALYNGKTGQRLSITYQECEEKIEQAAYILSHIGVYTSSLLNLLDLDKSLEELFSRLDEDADAHDSSGSCT